MATDGGRAGAGDRAARVEAPAPDRVDPRRVDPDWIAVDWGTSNLRAWALGGDGRVLAEGGSDEGMGRLAPDGFEPALLRVVGAWGRAPVVASGMVGARQGWAEAPYARVPCAPLARGLTPAPAREPGLSVGIVPGLAQDEPPDVMRGEETQVAGFLALNPGWDGVLCLPGTHSKWVAVSAEEVTGFRTCLTGELFALLAERSVLRHSVSPDGWDEGAFDEGVAEGLARPEALLGRLFSLRAESLLRGLAPEAARARLSGLLVGAELAAARGWWLGNRVGVIGAGGLARSYARALAAQGVAAEVADGTAATLAGLAAAWRRAGQAA